MLLHEQAFQLIGEGLVFLIFLLVIILIVGLILGIILVRRNKLLFPSVIIFIVNVFYSPLKSFANLLGLDDSLVDNIGIEVTNPNVIRYPLKKRLLYFRIVLDPPIVKPV